MQSQQNKLDFKQVLASLSEQRSKINEVLNKTKYINSAQDDPNSQIITERNKNLALEHTQNFLDSYENFLANPRLGGTLQRNLFQEKSQLRHLGSGGGFEPQLVSSQKDHFVNSGFENSRQKIRRSLGHNSFAIDQFSSDQASEYQRYMDEEYQFNPSNQSPLNNSLIFQSKGKIVQPALNNVQEQKKSNKFLLRGRASSHQTVYGEQTNQVKKVAVQPALKQIQNKNIKNQAQAQHYQQIYGFSSKPEQQVKKDFYSNRYKVFASGPNSPKQNKTRTKQFSVGNQKKIPATLIKNKNHIQFEQYMAGEIMAEKKAPSQPRFIQQKISSEIDQLHNLNNKPSPFLETTYYNKLFDTVQNQSLSSLRVLNKVFNQLNAETDKQEVFKQLSDFKNFFKFMVEEQDLNIKEIKKEHKHLRSMELDDDLFDFNFFYQ